MGGLVDSVMAIDTSGGEAGDTMEESVSGDGATSLDVRGDEAVVHAVWDLLDTQ